MAAEPRSDNYVLPWDAAEADRLDLQHRLLVKVIGGLFKAPLRKDSVRRILDLGCGTGIWTSDCAREYPDAEVVGIDLNNWPNWKDAPSNCTFKVGDMESDKIWSELGEPFDAIHCRFLMAGIKDWPAMVGRCCAHLVPGGWFEAQELDLPCLSDIGATAKDSKLMEWNDLYCEGLLKSGLTPGAADSIPPVLSKAGLNNAHIEKCKMKFGKWPDDAPDHEEIDMGTKNIFLGLNGFGEKIFTGTLGWSAQQHEELCDAARKDAASKEHHLYAPIKVCIAQN